MKYSNNGKSNKIEFKKKKSDISLMNTLPLRNNLERIVREGSLQSKHEVYGQEMMKIM